DRHSYAHAPPQAHRADRRPPPVAAQHAAQAPRRRHTRGDRGLSGIEASDRTWDVLLLDVDLVVVVRDAQDELAGRYVEERGAIGTPVVEDEAAGAGRERGAQPRSQCEDPQTAHAAHVRLPERADRA